MSIESTPLILALSTIPTFDDYLGRKRFSDGPTNQPAFCPNVVNITEREWDQKEASYLSTVQTLVRGGALPNERFTNYLNAIDCLAMRLGFLFYKNVAFYLIDNGLDVNQPIPEGSDEHEHRITALNVAARKGFVYASRFLIYCGAELHPKPKIRSALDDADIAPLSTYSIKRLSVTEEIDLISPVFYDRIRRNLINAQAIYNVVTLRLRSIPLTPDLSNRAYQCLMPYLETVEAINTLTIPIMRVMVDYYGFTNSEIVRLCLEEEQHLSITRKLITPLFENGTLCNKSTTVISDKEDNGKLQKNALTVQELNDAGLLELS